MTATVATEPRPKRRLRTWALRLGMLVLSPLLVLLVIELVWQLVGDPRYADYDAWLAGRPPHFALARQGLLRLDDDPEISYTLRPGFDTTIAGNRYRVNAHGLRGPEVSLQKPKGCKRILILGDSYAFGFGVAEADMLGAQLQRLLAPKHPGLEVLTLGAPGYQTGQQELVLRRDGLRFAPDVVVLVYYANDNMEPAQMYDPRLKTLYADVLPLPNGARRFLIRSILYHKITKAWTAMQSADDATAPPGTRALDARGTRHWPVTSARITRIAKLLEERGIGFVLLPIPALIDSMTFVTKDHITYRDHSRVLAFAAEKGIDTVDVRHLLMNRGTPIQKFPIEQLFVAWDIDPKKPRDSHFNAEGNRVVAIGLAKHIEAAGLLR